MKKKDNKKRNNIILYVALASFLTFLGFFVYYFYEYRAWVRDGEIAQQNSDHMREIFTEQIDAFSVIIDNIVHSQGNDPTNEQPIITPPPIGDYENEQENGQLFLSALELARISTNNNDIIAYIHIPNTNLSNIIVQTYNNNFYLHHDINKERNSNGAIFMDYRNSFDFSDQNTIIYGHNMRNGTMFHNIRYYMERDFFNNHPIITIITDEFIFIYQAFAAFSTMVDFYYIQVDFESNADFYALINEIKSRSNHPIPRIVNYNEQILILSTCTNAHEDERFVLASVLINIIQIP